MLGILIASLATWGSVVVVYASDVHPVVLSSTPVVLSSTPTVQPTATVKVINDKPATPAPDVVQSVIFQGSSTKPEIALTFDDGPNPVFTGPILNILQSNHVHATFFCVGENARDYPDMVAQENNAGHVVGNHTWNHPDLTQASDMVINKELVDTNNVIQSDSGVTPVLFRPPYGAINATVKAHAQQLHLTPVLWNIDTQDWSRPGTAAIVHAVLDHAGNGDIVLMHDGGGDRSQTVAALPQIIAGLQQRGFTLVTVPQLIKDMQ
ncbi:oligosaccharide deacetylase [Dictyobacter formicarum]|uniref:Oligosaccharide deacetylase n=1 Tax=Dictyobacter formicarum TaxID=2778368 RepID=A0ABQ3VK62_9CHLR|nr:oligosaccharide deacetylase [Dictyobacter formicarum]